MKMFRDFYEVIRIVDMKRLIWIQFVILVNAGAELLTVGLVPLYFALMADLKIDPTTFKFRVFNTLGLIHSGQVDIMKVGIFVFLLIVVANIFIVYTHHIMLRFSAILGAEISDSLFKYYLSRGYDFFIKSNSSQIVNDILLESQRMQGNVIYPLLTLVSKSLIVLIIFGIMLYVHFIPTVSVIAGLWLFYVLYYKSIQYLLVKHGKVVSELSEKRLKYLNEAFDLIKDLKIYKKEAYFTEKQFEVHRTLNIANMESYALSFVSKYFFETLIFGTACFTIYYINVKGIPLETMIPLISAYFLAAYKTLPSVQAIFSCFSVIKSNIHIFDKLKNVVAEGKEIKFSANSSTEVPMLCPKRVIELKNISYSYNGKEKQVADVSLSIPVGKKVAFVGESGAGKTTLANILLGLLPPAQGKIFVDGAEIQGETFEKWKNSVAFVPQAISLMDESIKDNITFFENTSSENLRSIILDAKAETIVDGLEKGCDSLVGDNGISLSGGQRQRLGLARALYFNKPILILDEATSALDNINEFHVMENIKRLQNKTVIIVAHRLSTIKDCDCIFVFDKGRLIDHGDFQSLIDENGYFRSLVLKEGSAINA